MKKQKKWSQVASDQRIKPDSKHHEGTGTLYHTSIPRARKGVIFMYEQLKNEMAAQLDVADFSKSEITRILFCLDLATYNYDVKPKETQIVPYNDELPSIVKQFLVVKSIKGLSEATLYGYKKHLEIFFFTVKKQPEQVKRTDIELFLYWYKQNRKISDRSLDKVLDCLKSFYNWMYECEYIDRDPARAVESIKYSKPIQSVLTEEELEIVRRSCKTLKEKALVEFFFSTGCRVAEVVNMKISDVDFKEKTVKIFGKGKKHRIGFINVRAEFALQDYLNSRTDENEYLFVSDRKPHNQMKKPGIEKVIRNIAERANLNKKLTCHVFRRTTATLLRSRGMAVEVIQQILGHEQINTTMIYTQVSTESIKAQYKQYMF